MSKALGKMVYNGQKWASKNAKTIPRGGEAYAGWCGRGIREEQDRTVVWVVSPCQCH